MQNYKRAMRFPNVALVNQEQVQPFSEGILFRSMDTVLETYDTLNGLLGYIVQRNQTQQLGKQIAAKKAAMDRIIEEERRQAEVALAEEAKRLQEWERTEKERLRLELEKLHLESSKTLQDFFSQYEEKMKKNTLLKATVVAELENMEKIKSFLNTLADEYSKRREYIMLCDQLSRSSNILEKYIQLLI